MNIFSKILAIASVVLITVSGCVKEEEPSGVLYSNVELEMKKPDGGAHFRLLDGEPFTGEQIFRYIRNDSVYIINKFQEGLRLQTTVYNEDGSVRARYKNKFRNGQYVGFTEYYSDGSKKADWLQGGATEGELGFTKEWYPNGQLKFEMQWDENNQYHGLMTKWDEQGNVIAQEKYEHGKQVEI